MSNTFVQYTNIFDFFFFFGGDRNVKNKHKADEFNVGWLKWAKMGFGYKSRLIGIVVL